MARRKQSLTGLQAVNYGKKEKLISKTPGNELGVML
jgi:hypothetical protein